MALLRIALLVALAACGRAGAQPSSGVTAPAGWQPLPSIATSVKDAIGTGIDGVEAWGETARGCYAVWISMQGAGATADAILHGLAAETITTSDVVKPEGDGITAVTFAKPPYTGRLRARTADGKITALACFANAREPKSCETPCTTLLGAIP